MDLKGKILISRNYRGDVPMSVAERFVSRVLDMDESELTPVLEEDGSTFAFIKYNNLYCIRFLFLFFCYCRC